MKFRPALLYAPTLSALLFLTACGGGSAGDGGTGGGGNPSPPQSEPQPSSSSAGGSTPSAAGSADGGGTGSTTCQNQAVVGGDLFVVDQAPVRVTLLANAGMTGGTFSFLYDNVFGFGTNNQQDKWGQAAPFSPAAPVGTATEVQIQPPSPDLVHDVPVPSTFPKGIPVELWLSTDDGNQPGPANVSSTASIHKDLPHDGWHTASVTYGANNTATVTFFSSVGGPAFSVGLTNVSGKAAPCSF